MIIQEMAVLTGKPKIEIIEQALETYRYFVLPVEPLLPDFMLNHDLFYYEPNRRYDQRSRDHIYNVNDLYISN